jgi:hypothetical protein
MPIRDDAVAVLRLLEAPQINAQEVFNPDKEFSRD